MGEFCRRDADGNKQEEYSGFGENSDIVYISDSPAIFWTFKSAIAGVFSSFACFYEVGLQGQSVCGKHSIIVLQAAAAALIHVGKL